MARYPQSGVAETVLGPASDDPRAELDVEVERPDGGILRVPAFVSGGSWRFRYSSELTGSHAYRIAGAESGEAGVIEIHDRPADAEGIARGGIRVTTDERRFEHADGTPFLWTGDTWWHGFVTRKISDDEFREFAERRAAQGFSVVQIVVLPPEAEPFDESVRCRTGWALDEETLAPNPTWFDDADIRIRALVECGLIPCIVGSWGYHLGVMDDRSATRFWRELVSRWAAYPVAWCIAGEPNMVMPSLLPPEVQEALRPEALPGEAVDLEELARQWEPYARPQVARLNLIARLLREIDVFRRPVTTHVLPAQMPWDLMEDESTLDFWMLQTGHGGHADIENAVEEVETAYRHEPVKPVVNGEGSYEGIAGGSWEDVQRLLFWSNILSGAAGFTYGAHGVWAMNTPEFPGQHSGLAPTWQEASRFRGGIHVGASSRWLRTLDWHTLTPRTDLSSPSQHPGARQLSYGAELADGGRVIYLPTMQPEGTKIWRFSRFEKLGGRPWRGRYVNLRNGEEGEEFRITPDEYDGSVLPESPARPSWEDWVVVLRPE